MALIRRLDRKALLLALATAWHAGQRHRPVCHVLGLSFNDAMRQIVTEDIAEITQNKENTAESVVADNEATKG